MKSIGYGKAIIFLALISILASGSIYGFEYIDRIEQANPWDFVLGQDKPEMPMPKMAFDSTHSYDAVHYDLFINAPRSDSFFSGIVVLTAVSNQEWLDQFWLHVRHLVTDSVMLGNYHFSYRQTDSTLIIDLPYSCPMGDTFAVIIYYHDYPQQRGFYYYPRNSYTMAEPYDARWWFPCFDEPWDKATADIYCIAPLGIDVASNGTLMHADTMGNSVSYYWRENYPMCTYLFSLAIGDFADWTVNIPDGRGDSIPCMYYVFHEDSANAVYDFANVPAMTNIFNNIFGPYPFEKYGMVAVEPFAYGGMEHQTMTTINRIWITGNRQFEYGIAHELAHMWWGDMVTLSDFRHVWLNEGFAKYSENIFAENFYGRGTYNQRIINYMDTYFYYDQYIGRFPLYNPVAIFNGAEYYKGALILHMLRGIIGDDNFFASLRHYATLYQYGNASTEDFRDAVETVSGVDLDYFFHEWIYEQGYPEYQYDWQAEPIGDNYRVDFNLVQVQQNAPIFSMPIQLAIRTTAGDTIRTTIFSSQQNETFQIMVPAEPVSILFDPDNWLLKKSQLTDIETVVDLPQSFNLSQNYPNPFNSTTAISFMVPHASAVKLELYDIGGRLVKTLVNDKFQAGGHTMIWDGTNQDGFPVSTGVYLCKMTTGDYRATRKMTYLK